MSEMCNDAKTKYQFYTCVLKNLLVTADKGSLINLTSVIVLINLVGPGLFQFAQAKAFNKLLFQLAFNKHLQVMVLKWS